jgi:hypothetical protein
MIKGSVLVQVSQTRANMQFKRRMGIIYTHIREEPLSIRQKKGMSCVVLIKAKLWLATGTACEARCKYCLMVRHLSIQQKIVGSIPTISKKAKSVPTYDENRLILDSMRIKFIKTRKVEVVHETKFV